MPNVICDICDKRLEGICKSKREKMKLLELLEERAERLCLTNIIINVSPGIKHKEITRTGCMGVLHYKQFERDPEGLNDFNLSDLISGKLSIEEAKKRIK